MWLLLSPLLCCTSTHSSWFDYPRCSKRPEILHDTGEELGLFARSSSVSGQLEQRQIAPPYNPAVESDRDLQHFDTQFTEEPPELTPDDESVIAKIDQSEFEGFEYVNPLQMSREDSV